MLEKLYIGEILNRAIGAARSDHAPCDATPPDEAMPRHGREVDHDRHQQHVSEEDMTVCIER